MTQLEKFFKNLKASFFASAAIYLVTGMLLMIFPESGMLSFRRSFCSCGYLSRNQILFMPFCFVAVFYNSCQRHYNCRNRHFPYV